MRRGAVFPKCRVLTRNRAHAQGKEMDLTPAFTIVRKWADFAAGGHIRVNHNRAKGMKWGTDLWYVYSMT